MKRLFANIITNIVLVLVSMAILTGGLPHKALADTCLPPSYSVHCTTNDADIFYADCSVSPTSPFQQVTAGQSKTFTWNVSTRGGIDPAGVMTYSWSSSWGSGSGTSFSGTFTSPGTYRATVQVHRQSSNGDYEDRTCSADLVVLPPPPPVITEFRAEPTGAVYDTPVTLVWRTQYVTSCTATGEWSGTRGPSGDELTDELTTPKTYSLQCTGEGGTTPIRSVTVNIVPPPPPTISEFRAVPILVASGNSTRLEYGFSGATDCSGTGWSFSWGNGTTVGGSSGSYDTDALSADQTFSLSCTRVGATQGTERTVTVSITACSDGEDNDGDGKIDFGTGASFDSGCANATDNDESEVLTVDLTASPATVTAGSNVTLTWSVTGANSCNAIGGWTWPAGEFDGFTSFGPVNATTDFGLSCTGPNGGLSDYARVTVPSQSGGTGLGGTCTVSPSSPKLPTASVTWTANPTGGTGSYTYQWGGSAGNSTLRTAQVGYTTFGIKTANVVVRSGTDSKTLNCSVCVAKSDGSGCGGNLPGGGGGTQLGSISNPLEADNIYDFLVSALRAFVNFLIPIIVLFYVLAGYMFVSAAGSPEKLAIAKKSFLFTTLGAAVVLGAWVLAEMIRDTINAIQG